MIIDELKTEINNLPSHLGWTGHGAKVMVAKDSVLELVRQLDEPKKVVVPKFVAEWIEDCKAKKMRLFDALMDNEAVNDWLDWGDGTNEDIFARAWLDGYVVEREEVSSNQVSTVFDKETLKKMVLDAAMWHLHCGNHKWPIDDMLKQIDKAFEEGGGTR